MAHLLSALYLYLLCWGEDARISQTARNQTGQSIFQGCSFDLPSLLPLVIVFGGNLHLSNRRITPRFVLEMIFFELFFLGTGTKAERWW